MVFFMTKKTAKTPQLSDRTLRSEKRIRPTPPCSCSILTPASTEDVYRTIFETTGTSTIIVGEDMSISMANRECEDLLGYTREEIRNGKKWDDFIATDELERLREYHRLRRIDPNVVPKTYETKLIDRKGNIKDVSITADLIPGTKNSVVSILDITKHKKAEEALRESEERYRILVETSPDAIVLMDLNNTILMVNPSALDLFGFQSSEEVIVISGMDFISPDDRPKALLDKKELLDTGKLKIVDYSLRKKDGLFFPCELKAGLMRDEKGRPRAIIIVIRDITDRKYAEQALHTSEEKYRTLVENVNIGVYRNTDGRHGHFLQANPAIVKMFGYGSVGEFLKVHTSELYQNQEDRKRFVEKIREQGYVKDEQLRLKKKDGTPIWGSVTAKVQYHAHGEIRWIDGVIEDITERKRAEEKLMHSLEALRSVYRIATTLSGSYEAVCDQVVLALSRLLRIPHVAVKHIEEDRVKIISAITDGHLTHDGVVLPEHSPCASIVCERNEPCQIRDRLQEIYPGNDLISSHRFEAYIGVPIKSIRGKAVGSICAMDYVARIFREDEVHLIEVFASYVAYEIERNAMESQLRHLDKMKLLGQMAAGVAHEVRNPLNAILAITDALFQDIGDNPDYRPFLDHIRTQVDRLARLMGDLLHLGKPIQQSVLQRESLPAICAASIDLWEQTKLSQTHKARLILPPEKDNLSLMADGSQLQQVFLNLLENAAQHSPKGTEIQFVLSIPKKRTVRICIADKGTGILEENLQKVFEPFFTTRERGNGLGLSIVKNTVQALGGEVVMRNNQPPPGCCVEITLPLAGKDET
jgi:PAS domain S-box-containing protein